MPLMVVLLIFNQKVLCLLVETAEKVSDIDKDRAENAMKKSKR